MLPKLLSLVAPFCVMPLFFTGSVAVLAQEASGGSDSGVIEPGRPESNGASPAIEFRYEGVPTRPESLPDSPSAARLKRDSLHGEGHGFWGSGLGSLPGIPLLSEFPLSQFGASAGGDVGRTSWFVGFDQYGMNTERLLAAVAAAQARSAKSVLPVNANVIDFSSFEGRVDHRFSAHDSGWARFTAGDAHSSDVIRGAGGSPAIGRTRRVKEMTATAANTADLSPRTVNESRVRYVSSEVELPPGASMGGVSSGLPTDHRDRVFEAADNVYRQVGGQSLAFGADFFFNQMAISFLESAMGRDSTFSQSGHTTGFYIQSRRQVRRNLLLTSGVEYQIQPLKGFKTDTNNLAPQVGFAWSPSSRTVIRGGGAVYYDQVPEPAIPGSSDQGGASVLENVAAFRVSPGSVAPQTSQFRVLNPLLQNSYVDTANFGIEQQLRGHFFVSSDYQFARGLQIEVPVYRPVVLCATVSACRAGNNLRAAQMGRGAESSYQGITVAVTQEPVRWGNYRVAYTRSSAEGSGTLGSGSYIDDRLSRASLSGVLHTSLEAGSGWVQHLSRGFILSGAGDYSTRTEFTGMNFINLNARLTKTLAWGRHYRLDGLVESVNSFERTNAAFGKSLGQFGDRAANIFSTYRSVASLQGPTGTQFGLKLGF